MLVAAVRNATSKNLLGFFWADSLEGLWWVVDDIAPPKDYEWILLPTGGALYYSALERPKAYGYYLLPSKPGVEPFTDLQLLGRFDMTDSILNDMASSEWKRFDDPAEGILETKSVKAELQRRASLPNRAK
jgi:hypothetical protein